MSKSLITRVINQLNQRRENIDLGNVNSIPSPFSRYTDYLVGVEQETYYIVTGYSGGAKSQFSYYYFVFEPLMFLYNNRDKYPDLKYTIFCLPLEETPERITQRFMSYLLFRLSNGRYLISPKNLRSSENSKPAPKEILETLSSKEFLDILNFFERSITFVLDVTPLQFYEKVKKYCEDNGKVYYKKVLKSDEFGNEYEAEEFDHYVPNNPKEYVIALVDHISLLPASDIKETIISFSKYMVSLRNRYKVSPVIVQQQSASNESLDAFKLERSRPTRANLADSKYTGRDANIIISIYNPFGHNIKSYAGYDLTELRGNARFIELLKNRDGPENVALGLLFNGACAYFRELAAKNDAGGITTDCRTSAEYEERSKKLIYIKDYQEIINDLV